MPRLALVTGGSRGIGAGVAGALARAGYDLLICGRRTPEAVTEAVAELARVGGEVVYLAADVSDAEDRQALLELARSRFGRLDVLVNNAGVAPRQRLDLLEATEESFDYVLDTNLKGPYFLSQAAARWMVEQRRSGDEGFKTIVFVTSVSAALASVNRGEYCVSKAGLSMAAQLFAVRLAEFDIPVFEVRPGIVHTDMTSGVKALYDRKMEQGLLLQQRWGSPDDVGRVVAALAAGELAYSTGQVITVDGGMTVGRL